MSAPFAAKDLSGPTAAPLDPGLRRGTSGVRLISGGHFRAPMPLPVPFRDDVFDAGFHRQALVEGGVVRLALRVHVVPGEQVAAVRRDADAGAREVGLAAAL